MKSIHGGKAKSDKIDSDRKCFVSFVAELLRNSDSGRQATGLRTSMCQRKILEPLALIGDSPPTGC